MMTEEEDDEGTCLDNDALGAEWYDPEELKAQEYKGPFTVEQINELLNTIQTSNWLQR